MDDLQNYLSAIDISIKLHGMLEISQDLLWSDPNYWH